MTLVLLPIWIGMTFSVGQQVVSGFDDFSLVSNSIGLLVGFILMIVVSFFVFSSEANSRYRVLKKTAFVLLSIEIIIWIGCVLLTKYFIEV
jgi:hypothetical protein